MRSQTFSFHFFLLITAFVSLSSCAPQAAAQPGKVKQMFIKMKRIYQAKTLTAEIYEAGSPEWIYRADTRSPQEILKNGFGLRMDGRGQVDLADLKEPPSYFLEDHVTAPDDNTYTSPYVSAAKSEKGAQNFAEKTLMPKPENSNKDFYVYEIHNSPNTIDVQESLQKVANLKAEQRGLPKMNHPHYDEEEIVIVGGAPPEQIRGFKKYSRENGKWPTEFTTKDKLLRYNAKFNKYRGGAVSILFDIRSGARQAVRTLMKFPQTQDYIKDGGAPSWKFWKKTLDPSKGKGAAADENNGSVDNNEVEDVSDEDLNNLSEEERAKLDNDEIGPVSDDELGAIHGHCKRDLTVPCDYGAKPKDDQGKPVGEENHASPKSDPSTQDQPKSQVGKNGGKPPKPKSGKGSSGKGDDIMFDKGPKSPDEERVLEEMTKKYNKEGEAGVMKYVDDKISSAEADGTITAQVAEQLRTNLGLEKNMAMSLRRGDTKEALQVAEQGLRQAEEKGIFPKGSTEANLGQLKNMGAMIMAKQDTFVNSPSAWGESEGDLFDVIQGVRDGKFTAGDCQIGFVRTWSLVLNERWHNYSSITSGFFSVFNMFFDAIGVANPRTWIILWGSVQAKLPSVCREVAQARTRQAKRDLAFKDLHILMRAWLITPLGLIYEMVMNKNIDAAPES